jgi:hypothetical protein
VLPDPRRLPASPAQLERAWDARQTGRYQRGEISQRPGYTINPFRATLTTTSCHRAARVVQDTGRRSGADGSIVTSDKVLRDAALRAPGSH